MSKVLVFVVAWVVAAGVSLAVAWQGVAIVGDQVTARRPAPLSAREIQAQVQADDAATGATTTTTMVASAAVESPTSTAKPPIRSTPTPTTIPNPRDDGARTGDDGGRQQPPAPTTTTAPSPAPAATTRTYNLVGGSVSLKFSSSGVTVNWANPNAGYGVSIEPEDGNGVRVEFESDSHRSRVDGWWADGPQDRVREEAR
ncbi:MAG: hypothetical protein QOF60_3365 [Actinomycetota bacterium]|nr:hypothetical protein [Actinomycetota bacterium]